MIYNSLYKINETIEKQIEYNWLHFLNFVGLLGTKICIPIYDLDDPEQKKQKTIFYVKMRLTIKDAYKLANHFAKKGIIGNLLLKN
jgi:hypothetical protein